MPFDQPQRTSILRERADAYVRVALAGITREYPHMPYFVATESADYRTHRERHPAFYGCFDWHSCVEMHWAVVRLLRLFPDAVPAAEARATLDGLLTEENLAVEAAFFARPEHRSLERPYGWGWLLTLQHELATWDDPDARRWAAAVAPLAAVLTGRLLEWLPKLTYPQRTGVHPNTAFGLSRCLDWATLRAEVGDEALHAAIVAAAGRWFGDDTDYPAGYEPSGADFLSPALVEAELMSRVLPPGTFPDWLGRFLPGLAEGEPGALFAPAAVSDPTDGQIAHLHGLNLSRAWAFVALAARLPEGDARIGPLLAGAERHAAASLPHVVGGDYMTEHWLAAYATLLLG
jgi:hypothetical protein